MAQPAFCYRTGGNVYVDCADGDGDISMELFTCSGPDASTCTSGGGSYGSRVYSLPETCWDSAESCEVGGGSTPGTFPELSQSDIALIGGKILLIFALVFSIKIVYSVIMNRR